MAKKTVAVAGSEQERDAVGQHVEALRMKLEALTAHINSLSTVTLPGAGASASLEIGELEDDLRRLAGVLGGARLREVFSIRKYVHNPDAAELQETYDAIDALIANAGHLTIGDLFRSSAEDIGPAASRAIQRAKAVGFLQMNNYGCCDGGQCKEGKRGFCSRSPTGGCSATSTPCD